MNFQNQGNHIVSRRAFLKRSAKPVEVKTTQPPNENDDECSGNQDSGGSTESGDNDDGEPPTAAAVPSAMEWWQISLLAASVVTVFVFSSYLCILKPSKFCLPVVVGTFAVSFVTCLFLNPSLRFLRLAAAALSGLIAANVFGGCTIVAPISWSEMPFIFQIPETDWSFNIILGAVAIVFGRLQFLNERAFNWSRRQRTHAQSKMRTRSDR